MKGYDREKFGKAMLLLADVLERPITQSLLEAYFEDLQRFEIGEVEAALKIARQTLKFFPKPTEIIELIEGSQDDKTELAWNRFWSLFDRYSLSRLDSLLFEDYALYEAIVATFQDWATACNCPRPVDEVMVDHQMYRKNFKEAYRRALRKPTNQGQSYLAGEREKALGEQAQKWAQRLDVTEPMFVLVPKTGEPRRVPLKALDPSHPLVALYEKQQTPALVGGE